MMNRMPENESDHLAMRLKRFDGWRQHLRKGVLDALVLVCPASVHLGRVLQAVDTINSAQSYYRLKIGSSECITTLSPENKSIDIELVRNEVEKMYPNQLVIVVCDRDLEIKHHTDRVTICEKPGCTIISCDDWKENENGSKTPAEAPVMRVYLLYQFTSALITFAGCLTEAENDSLTHKGEEMLKGCLFDYWVGGKRLSSNMVAAWLCPACRSSLLQLGTPTAALAATEKLLDWIRSVVLGRERRLPDKIFIGHGRNEDWKELKIMLEGWGLHAEEFNEEPVAGISITERLKAMLEQSRFAFLVMTGEDKTQDGQLQARMNVIHEIGLFQGRLGTESAVVLRRKETNVFSNLDGITRLDYAAGELRALKDEIRRLLIARGVMAADVKDKD